MVAAYRCDELYEREGDFSQEERSAANHIFRHAKSPWFAPQLHIGGNDTPALLKKRQKHKHTSRTSMQQGKYPKGLTKTRETTHTECIIIFAGRVGEALAIGSTKTINTHY